MTKPCSHELHEMETASAWDGLCPICLKEKVDRLEQKITKLESKRKSNPLTADQFLLEVKKRMGTYKEKNIQIPIGDFQKMIEDAK